MRCLSCEQLSFEIICQKCQINHLQPVFNKRELEKDFFVYSFYEYDTIKDLLNTKYQFYGDKVFQILANNSFKKFAENFEFPHIVTALPIDDHVNHDFSHTAILAKTLSKSKNIDVRYNLLHAHNKIKYAGKSLEFRKNNPRDFRFLPKISSEVILIDDLVTTGLTILEAKKVIQKSNNEVLFALTLSDAKF